MRQLPLKQAAKLAINEGRRSFIWIPVTHKLEILPSDGQCLKKQNQNAFSRVLSLSVFVLLAAARLP